MVDVDTDRCWQLSLTHQWHDALGCYDHVLMQEPTHALAWYCRGQVLEQLHRPEDARQSYEQAVRRFDEQLTREPQNAWAWYVRGNALDALGRYADALASQEQAIAHGPMPGGAAREASVWDVTYRLLARLGRNDEAHAAHERADTLRHDALYEEPDAD